MRCPACGQTIQHFDRACLRCGTSLLEAFENRAWQGLRRTARRAAPPRVRRAGLGALLGAALALGLWAAARRPGPAAPPPGGFLDPAGGLAFSAPPGWSLNTGFPEGWRFQRLAELTGPGGSIAVDAAPAGLPVAAHLAALVSEEFNGRRPKVEEPSGALLAGVEARRCAFQAGGAAGEAVALGGAGRTYLIRFYSDAAGLPKAKPGWTAFLDSLRLTRGGR